VRLHFTLIIVFFLVAWTLASSFMPQYFLNLATVQYWIMGAIGAIILFISVFLHELMHSVIALRYGIKVRQIILFIFGKTTTGEEGIETLREIRELIVTMQSLSIIVSKQSLQMRCRMHLKIMG
jgi:Zn-dependent protease